MLCTRVNCCHILLFSAVPPIVSPSDEVSNKPISMGESVTISFTIVNEPAPKVTREGIQWVFSGIGGAVNLSCTSTSKYSFSDNCLSLTVSNAEGSDAGQYQIVITTEAGTGMSAVAISVSGGALGVGVHVVYMYCCIGMSLAIPVLYCS